MMHKESWILGLLQLFVFDWGCMLTHKFEVCWAIMHCSMSIACLCVGVDLVGTNRGVCMETSFSSHFVLLV